MILETKVEELLGIDDLYDRDDAIYDLARELIAMGATRMDTEEIEHLVAELDAVIAQRLHPN